MKLATIAIVAAALSSFAEDITIARGETFNLSENAAYGTVTVSGTLNIPDGLTLTADTLELGPNAGDTAVVNVLGSSKTGLNVTNAVNVGSNGGSGQIVALSPAATHNTGWDGLAVVCLSNVNISVNAAVSPSGFVDFLMLGPGTVNFATMSNESSARARILVANGCIGYLQYWGTTMFKGLFQVESFNGGDIRFGSNYAYRILNSGSLIIKGNGRDVYFCRYADKADQYYSLKNGIEWDSVRDVVLIERHPMKVEADNLLPYGPSIGAFRIDTANSLAVIDIGSTVQYLNSFSSYRSFADGASLKGAAGGRVVFGEGDTDGFLKGYIHENIGVFKVGTGIFSITNEAQVGSMTVSAGTLKVAAAFALEELTVASGATIEIDGVTLAPSSGRAVIDGAVVLKNGGRLLSSMTVQEDERLAGYKNAGEWTKDGTGTLILEDPIFMPSNVYIKAGTVAFASEGYACDLFKWTVSKWNNIGYFDTNNGAAHNMFYLGELAFIDQAGNRIGAGAISSAAIGTDPKDLQRGQASFAAGTELMTAGGGGNARNLFDQDQWPRVGVVSPLLTNGCSVTLYVRLPAGSESVSAINFAGAYGGLPKSWTLSGSTDGGETWHVLNEVSDYAIHYDDPRNIWMGAAEAGTAGIVVPKAFPLGNVSIEWASSGVRNMPNAMQLRVDAGAVLDFTNVTGGQTVDAITVDVSGGGTIRNAKFAAAGTVFLTGVSDGMEIRDMSVPLALEDCEGLDNLGLWTICVNGEAQRTGKYHVAYRDGQLYFLGNGLRIIVK